MINKEQALHDIQQMTPGQRYSHLISLLDVVLQDKQNDAHKDATSMIHLHVKIARESMMSQAKFSYT